MGNDTTILPALELGETYTDPDFLLVQSSTDSDGETVSEIDRMFAAKREDDTGSWVCKTITTRTKMSHEAAMMLAKAYAQTHHVPVIYERYSDERSSQPLASVDVVND